jgi:hypothetical protein
VNPKIFTLPLRSIQLSLVFLWLYQGLIPKILFQSAAEIAIWQNMGFELNLAKIMVGLSGLAEMIFGLLFLKWNHFIILHCINIVGLIVLLLLIIITDPLQLTTAFNPMVMNIAMLMLSVLAIQLIQLQKISLKG